MKIKNKQTINYVQKLDRQVFQQDVNNKYACQCGKQYHNFPALYLHFQRSHKVKISTKLAEKGCRVTKKERIRTFTYYYSQKALEGINIKNKQTYLNQIFKQFTHSIQDQTDRYPAFFLCQNLYKFLMRQENFVKQPFEYIRLNQIPNYFNDFMNQSQSLMKIKEIYEYNCSILIQLSRWLNFKGFSKIKLEYNQTNEQQQIVKEESSRCS